MITSLDIFANAMVQKNNTVDPLPNPKVQQPDGTPKETVTPLVTELASGTTAKLADTKSLNIKMMPQTKTRWEAAKKRNLGGIKDHGAHQQGLVEKTYYKIINSIYLTPGCANPPHLQATAFLHTAANTQCTDTTGCNHPTSINNHATIFTLTTSDKARLSLPKLPQSSKQAYHIPGLTNNLLSAAILSDAGCELFFYQTRCDVSYNGEIILRRWQDPTTRLRQVSLQTTDGPNIVPHDASIVSPTEPTFKHTASMNARTHDNSLIFSSPAGVNPSTKATSKGGMD
ncbi:hypothetical protein ACHAW6_001245 [Cyclotella cf. meneghiniana]